MLDQQSLTLLLVPAVIPVLGMKFVRLPKGTFYMGWAGAEGGQEDRNQGGLRDRRHTVTQGQWQALMGNNPSYFSRNGGGKDRVKDISDEDLKQFPAEDVSWDEAQAVHQEAERKARTAEAGRTVCRPRRNGNMLVAEGPLLKKNVRITSTSISPLTTFRPTQANFDGT